MFNLVERYMSNLTSGHVNDFALKNGVRLSDSELDFTYRYVKNNWRGIISNPQGINFEEFKNQFSEENFEKIKRLFFEYSSKYQGFL